MKAQLKYAWDVLRKSVVNFSSDNCFLFSASLSFYTLFSLAPVVLISIETAGLFIDNAAIREEIISQFERLLGKDGANGIEVLLETIQRDNQSTISIIIGVIVLIVMATNIFIQIQNSFDIIFRVRAIKKKNLIKQLLDRAISLGMILGLGFVLIISLILDSVIVSVSKYFLSSSEELSAVLVAIMQNGVILVIVYFMIFALFRFLADIELETRFLWKSSLITTILLLIGKFGIGWYIANSSFSELAGASASVIILMLWVYYSSFILFFGAQTIKAQFQVSDVKMKAGRYAKRIRYMEVNDDEDGK